MYNGNVTYRYEQGVPMATNTELSHEELLKVLLKAVAAAAATVTEPVPGAFLGGVFTEVIREDRPDVIKALGDSATRTAFFNRLDDLRDQGLLTLTGEGYSLTETGRTQAAGISDEKLEVAVRDLLSD